MKNPFKRENTAIVERANIAEASTNIETMIEGTTWSGSTRYCDPLIRDHIIDKKNPDHRERVAAEDPLGILITRAFSSLGWARDPKFYASDEQGAPEIMQDVRLVYDMLNMADLCTEATFDKTKHGWVGGYIWLDADETGKPALMSEIYSAKTIRAEDIIRNKAQAYQMAQDDGMPPEVLMSILKAPVNTPLVWQVRSRYPPVPAGYSNANLQTIARRFYIGQPGWIVDTRGDFNKTLGYGYSRLVDNWDSITKLRVTSHSDAKRNEIFPIIVYPDSYEPDQVDSLFEALAKVDENAGLAVPSAIDSEGSPVVGLPTIAWRSPAEDAPNVSGEAGPRGLPAELMRFCALTGITVKELAGDPGGAQEAGATDIAQALEKNIQEFNISGRTFLKKLLLELQKLGVPLAIPPNFVIKGHWEWERDEMMAAQAQLQDEQMDIEHEKADKKPTKNVAVEWYENEFDPFSFHETMRENAVPGVMAPITSSWVKSSGYDQDNFYMQFHGAGSKIFRYPYTDDPKTLAEGIETSGSPGGFVHDSPELGVPRRTPYDTVSQLPGTMAWAGDSQAGVEYDSADMRDDKMAQFGTKRPARAPNQQQYPGQTAAQTEQTTGPIQDTTPKPPFQTGVRSFPKVDFASMQGTKPKPAPGGLAPPFPGLPLNMTGEEVGVERPIGFDQMQRNPLAGQPAQATAAAPLSTPVALEHPLMAKHGHAGHSARGRKKDEAKAGGAAYGVNYTGAAAAAYGTQPYSYNSAIPVRRVNASILDLSENELIDLSKRVNGQGFSATTVNKIQNVLRQFNGTVRRSNHVSIGNSMSFKDHPYLYAEEDGTVTVEYPCAIDWRKNVVGKTRRLKINPKDTSKHGNVEVGSITYGWDEKNNCPLDTCDYDRENVMRLIEAAGGTGSEVYRRLVDNEEPDRSTEYQCRVENHAGKRWQREFEAGDTCLVDRGNCPSGRCDFQPQD